MILSEEQYERIARRLDGEAVALSETERAFAEQVRDDETHLRSFLDALPPAGMIPRVHAHVVRAEVRRDEAALAGLLDADVPPAALDRAYRRVVADLARPRRRLLRIGAAASAVAVAAGLLLAVGLAGLWDAPTPRTDPQPVAAAQPVPVEVLSASIQQADDPAVDLLQAELDDLEADLLAAAPPASVDFGIDHVEQALFDLLLDDLPE